MNKICPQNTLSSFKKSIDIGLDSVELDVWLTKDMIPVVIHGGEYGEIEEFTDGKRNVKEMTLNELKDVNTIEGKEKVSTLEKVFQLCKGKCLLI